MSNLERINQIIEFQITPVSNVISVYSTDDFIKSYANQIKSYNKYPKDKEKILFLIDKLLDWYKNELPDIEKDNYIHNKLAHIQSKELLEELKLLINTDN